MTTWLSQNYYLRVRRKKKTLRIVGYEHAIVKYILGNVSSKVKIVRYQLAIARKKVRKKSNNCFFFFLSVTETIFHGIMIRILHPRILGDGTHSLPLSLRSQSVRSNNASGWTAEESLMKTWSFDFIAEKNVSQRLGRFWFPLNDTQHMTSTEQNTNHVS